MGESFSAGYFAESWLRNPFDSKAFDRERGTWFEAISSGL